MVSAQRPDRALHRARAAVAGALRRRRLPPRQPALDRGGAEVFRARGAVLGAAALRREPHLRLFRHHRIRRHRRGDRAGAAAARADLRAGVPRRRHRLQGVGRAVPHVDARRLRGLADAGDRLLPDGAEGGGGGDVRAAAVRRVRRRGRRVAADPVAPVGGLDVPRRGRGDRPAQLQAADGLFLDRPHGLRADGPRRRHPRGGAVAADLSRDLRDDERRRLRLHPEHGARRQAGARHLFARALQPGRIRRGRWRWRCSCSASPACRRWSASSGSSTC